MSQGCSPYPGVEYRELLEQIEEKGLKLSTPKPCPSFVYEFILYCTQHKEQDRPFFSEIRSRLDMYAKMEKGEPDTTGDMVYQTIGSASNNADSSVTSGEAKPAE